MTDTIVDVSHLSYYYGRVAVLRDVTFSVPRGALYALIGPNGAGKSTLLQILSGLRRARHGAATVMGKPSTKLATADRATIGYIGEGQLLPGWMRLEQLEAYLAPLYDTWDAQLADHLRERFELDPSQKIRQLSRGEYMKAALLCALAPRPQLLIMDEPFTGMDALVKDELVRGLLESAGSEGWTVLLCSHDIGELELLADWVGFLDRGVMRLSEPMDVLRQCYKHVELTTDEPLGGVTIPDSWLSLDHAASRVEFVVAHEGDDVLNRVVAPVLPRATNVTVRPASLRETFVALARRPHQSVPE